MFLPNTTPTYKVCGFPPLMDTFLRGLGQENFFFRALEYDSKQF